MLLGSIPIESIQWASSWPRLASQDEREFVLGYLRERFGIPTPLFDDYLFFRTRKGWWLLGTTPHLEHASGLKVEVVGLRAFSMVGRFIKPSTRFIQLFGRAATRSKVNISEEELGLLLQGKALNRELNLSKGYVILELGRQAIVGLGLWDGRMLHSQLPKSFSNNSHSV